MQPVEKSIYLSDRLQLVIGAAGGFSRYPDQQVSQPRGNSSLSRRVNVIGDRYWALIEGCDLTDVLSEDDLVAVGNAFPHPWRHSADRILSLPRRLAEVLGIEDDQGLQDGSAEASLVLRVMALDRLQLFALVEWIENVFPDTAKYDF